MEKIVYLIIRLSLGISIFMHGFVRIPVLDTFTYGLVSEFTYSFLPNQLIQAFAYALPFLELIIGLCLIIGLLTKRIAIAGSFLMLILIFGVSLIENWNALPAQFIHLIFYIALIQYNSSNAYAIDRLTKKPHRITQEDENN